MHPSNVCKTFSFTCSSPPVASTPDILRQEISRRLAAIDENKQEFLRVISRERAHLKYLWNRSLVINQLPNELLTQIFVGFAAMTGLWKDSFAMKVARLMRICRHWRDVVLATPELWCEVDLGKNITRTGLCLARSAAAPIDVKLDSVKVLGRMSTAGILDGLRLSYTHAHRFRSFFFHVMPENIPDLATTLLRLFNEEMPTLENFNLNIRCYCHYEHSMADNLPLDLASRRLPRLRSLALNGIPAPQDTSLYAQLRTLSLNTSPNSVSLDDFLDALASCTLLEELSLEATIESLSGDWISRSRSPISIPRLRKLELRRHSPVCTSRFLAHFLIRPSTDLTVEAMYPATAHAITAMLPPNYSVTIEALTTATDIGALLTGDVVWIHGSEGTWEDVPTTYLAAKPISHWDGAISTGLDDLVESFGGSPVTSISLSWELPVTAASWARVFRTFPLLERLDAWQTPASNRDSMAIANLFGGLHEASTVNPGSDSQVVCPNLKSIHLYGVESREMYEAVRKCFRYRKDKGVVLEELRLPSRVVEVSRHKIPLAVRQGCMKSIEGGVREIYPSAVSKPESEEENTNVGQSGSRLSRFRDRLRIGMKRWPTRDRDTDSE